MDGFSKGIVSDVLALYIAGEWKIDKMSLKKFLLN